MVNCLKGRRQRLAYLTAYLSAWGICLVNRDGSGKGEACPGDGGASSHVHSSHDPYNLFEIDRTVMRGNS